MGNRVVGNTRVMGTRGLCNICNGDQRDM